MTKPEIYQRLLGYVGRDERELAAFLLTAGARDEPPLSLDDAYTQARELVEFLDSEMQRALRDEI